MPAHDVAVRGITIDVTDLDRSASFWSRLLGITARASSDTTCGSKRWLRA
jgi:catechol-2,3-dioxygenase